MGATGTLHYQGYVELIEPVRFTYFRGIDEQLETAHFEKRYGSRDQARDYCRKQDQTYIEGPWEYGTWETNQGNRNDLYEMKKDIDAGAPLADIQDNYFGLWVRNYNAVAIYVEARMQEEYTKYDMSTFNREPLDLSKPWMIYGNSGTAKTSYALAHFNQPLLCSHLEDLRKFRPKYHDGIVFDDMSFKHLPPETMIHLLDVEQTRTIYARHHNVTIPKGVKRIIVHNYKEAIYSDKILDEQVVAVNRRINFLHVILSLKKS